MRVMIFVDLENFKESLWRIHPDRQPDIKRFHFFLFNHIINKHSWNKFIPRFIRAYVYTGEYTDSIISKIKKEQSEFGEETEEYGKIQEYLDKTMRRKTAQESFLNFSNYCSFLEIKKTPLHYTPRESLKGELGKGIFQKGVDVQLAVDLVSHAYKDNFDLALVCSGDVDLIESLRLIKSLGKKAILISHPSLISNKMSKECDYFCKLDRFTNSELDGISRIINRR